MVDPSSELLVGQFANFEAEIVKDIMDDRPRFVKESTSLSDMASMLMEEKINELPVVDDDRRVIGQVNIYEVITAYLDEIRRK